MPFYFRKSISIGGIRLNFSKSGVSYSTSPIKGFRITTGQHGTYATVGSHGFYYRKRLDKPKEQPPPPSNPPRQSWEESWPTSASESGESIPTGDVADFVDATSETMIKEINDRKLKTRTAPFMGIGCGLLSLILLCNGFESLGVIAAIATTAATVLAAIHDRTQRTTFLHYEVENKDCNFVDKQRICQLLSHSIKVWRVSEEQSTWDWKRNAGAIALVKRKQVVVGKARPPCLETNIEVWSIDAGGTRLFFFPDYIFVLQNGVYGAVPYESLWAKASETRFVEDWYAPSDSTIAGYSWRYVRRDGGPDRRFSNNRQLPIAVYGLLVLGSSRGLNLHFQCSNKEIAKRVADQIAQVNPAGPELQSAERERAERERAERERAERKRAEQQRAEQQRAEQQRSEQQRAEQQRSEQQRSEQQRSERDRAERDRAERDRAERQRAEQQSAERKRAEQQRAEQEWGERQQAETERERAERRQWEKEREELQQRERQRAEELRAKHQQAGQAPMSVDVKCPRCGFSRWMDVKFAGRTLVCPCGEEFIFTPSHSAEQRQQQSADQEWREQFRAREKKWQEKWKRPQAGQQQADQQKAERERAERAERERAAQSSVKSDYEILQVSINAPDEVITAAHRRLAKMYHPDMVEHLAPEYKEIAIKRMKEINDAYGRLKTRHG
jgi:hypothetical protein